MMADKIDRRRFIGKGVLAGAGAAATAFAGPAVARRLEGIQWTDEADVVILGGGLAGCLAAIEAHDTDRSAKVLIVEKMSEPLSGGNSRLCGESLWLPEGEDLEAILRYRRALDYPNPIPEDLARTWAEEMVAQPKWIREMMSQVGHELIPQTYNDAGNAEFAEFPGAETANGKGWTGNPPKPGVWAAFKAQVDRRPLIRFVYETRAVDLVQDPDSLEVFGVCAEQEGKKTTIKANRAVVMCTGGYENNLDMQRNYAGMERVYPLGTVGNTGDGIKMLQKAGADLWHLRNRNTTSGIWPSLKVPDYPYAFFRRQPQAPANGWLDIAKDNRRFLDEAFRWSGTHYRHKVHDHWVDTPLPFVLPVHMIFDEAARKDGPLGTSTRIPSGIEGYEWSMDNSAEIAKNWIIKSESIRELAERMGRDPDEVEATVNQFNQASEAGHDPEFGRDPNRMSPIKEPPFYAVEIQPGIVCTTGGAKRNKESQVLDQSGMPIKRLYEAGELGSTWANLYQNGSFLTECIISGRIAGRNAVAESPWTEMRAVEG